MANFLRRKKLSEEEVAKQDKHEKYEIMRLAYEIELLAESLTRKTEELKAELQRHKEETENSE